jgi:pimeloyl-ACP methyl ester carboxylesterase
MQTIELLKVRTRLGEACIAAVGPATAPPVILFEGIAAGPIPFGLSLTGLGEGFRVFSLPAVSSSQDGHGRPSVEDAHGPGWLGDILDGLRLSFASFVGLSRGARAVSSFAGLQPERVERVALLSPVGVLPQRQSYLDVFRMRAGGCPGHRPWLGRGSLRRIIAPTMLLVGEHDRRLGRKTLLRSARRSLPNLVLAAIVPEAGHALHLDQPRAVSAVLADFLRHGDDWRVLPQFTHSARPV